ncbi:hypothetical protein [Sphingomonas sp. 8AM]|uniref:hypothetical protein n=1 Tax=Sphingomonas sp. 8AM TaxID=2653170 RepID=UPI0012F3537D|nr:hypothetical protein [Sphingomonas sp. 8AM]VXC98466.1 hypothetical protein SPHINGO8AM_60104 [Sphingomonas sp. 8AM]
MKQDQVNAISTAQIGIGQLGTLLSLMAEGVSDSRAKDAIEACSDRAKDIADQMDDIPGFVEGQTSRQSASSVLHRHAEWLTARQATLKRAEGLEDGTAKHDEACIAVNELDRRIMATPANSQVEMLAKLALVAAVIAEGASPTPEDAARIAAEAEPFLAGEA